MNNPLTHHDDVKVLTFNLLADRYAKPSLYYTVDREYLASHFRWNKIKQLMSSFMKNGYVLLLQEVSDLWDSKLSVLFQTNGYFYFSSVYDGPNLGVAIAIPRYIYEVVEIDVFTPNELIANKVTKVLEEDRDLSNKITTQHAENQTVLSQLLESITSPNKMITITMNNKISQRSFIVSTYHMPCRFTKPYYMMIHLWAIQKRLFDIQEKTGFPVILAGDFNLKPISDEYAFMTQNNNNQNIDSVRRFKEVLSLFNIDVSQRIKMKSVFQIMGKPEPEYTNAVNLPNKAFKDTIDYILVSEHGNRKVSIRSALVGLVTENPLATGYPNAICPSDHLPVSSSLIIY